MLVTLIALAGSNFRFTPLVVVLIGVTAIWTAIVLAHSVYEHLEPGDDLKVTVEHEDWDNFQHLAKIVEARVGIKNRRNRRKKVTAFRWVTSGGPLSTIHSDVGVLRELERRRADHPRLDHVSIIEPRRAVEGWLVNAFPLDASKPGPAFYELSVYDETGLEYVATLKRALRKTRQGVAPDAGAATARHAYLKEMIERFRRSESADWLAEQSHLWTHPEPHIIFSIRSKIGVPYLVAYECRVKHPNGHLYIASDTTPGSGLRLFFRYPNDFPGAEPAVAGTYEVTWRLPGRGGRMREALRYSQTLKLGE